MSTPATQVRERPLLMSSPMVRATLDDRKTCTRRVVLPQPAHIEWFEHQRGWCAKVANKEPGRPDYEMVPCPHGVPGDRLWVRETFASPGRGIVAYRADGECGAWMGDGGGGRIWIRHGGVIEVRGARGPSWGLTRYGGKWRPSIFMPRWASRLTPEVTEVRVERLQDITEEDALSEGIQQELLGPDPDNFHPPGSYGFVHGLDPFPKGRIFVTAREAYAELWDRLNGDRGFPWATNPWVWRVGFRRCDA